VNDDRTPGFVPACPIPQSEYPHILMAHGGGGRLMQSLIEKLFVASFDNAALRERHDGAVVDAGGARIAFTTDTYVVRPLFFPGGDIGSLSVHGTVNDLAMCGARPLALSAALVLEEGFPIKTLWRIVRSMDAAARAAGVDIVTGDTKVVERGKGDGIFINTAGVGVVEAGPVVAPSRVRAGDCIILSGDIGRHGIAIMSAREGLEFEHEVESDSAPLCHAVRALLESGVEVHCMRDLTRGGLGAALCEVAGAAGVDIEVDETAVSVREDVRGACELLGLDPMFVANEGRFVVFVPQADADAALSALQSDPAGALAVPIGRVSDGSRGRVTVRTSIGTTSLLDTPSGEQLPRIC
jgi:hydrogenase expression/formation protein HypE